LRRWEIFYFKITPIIKIIQPTSHVHISLKGRLATYIVLKSWLAYLSGKLLTKKKVLKHLALVKTLFSVAEALEKKARVCLCQALSA
jgi:hypothetical protein